MPGLVRLLTAWVDERHSFRPVDDIVESTAAFVVCDVDPRVVPCLGPPRGGLDLVAEDIRVPKDAEAECLKQGAAVRVVPLVVVPLV